MEGAVEVVEVMTGENVRHPIDDFVCSAIVSGFCKIGKPRLGLEFYEKMIQIHEFRPSLVTYTAVVDALCREGRLVEACELVGKMEEEGVVIDAVVYGSLICGDFRRRLLTERLRKHRVMVENGVVPDEVSYGNLINALCKDGSVEKVIGFLDEMEERGVKPNVVIYTTIIQGFCKRGKTEEALSVLRKMEELGVMADEKAYSILINGLCMKGDLEGVFALLDEMGRREIELGSVTYNTVINGLCKTGRIDKADEISRGFCGDNYTYSTLLHGFMKEKDVTGVKETKKRLEAAGFSIDVVTCNVLIKAMFVVGMVDEASKLFKEMIKKGIVPNAITYCTMVDGYCKIGMVDEALEVFSQYRRASPPPNPVCLDHIIRGLCKKDSVDKAVEVFLELIENDIVINYSTCKMLVRAQFKDGDGDGVLKLIYRLEKLYPDFLSNMCNDAITFLCIKGSVEAACDIYMLLKRRGLDVASKSYYFLIKCLIRSGNKEIVQLLLGDFLKVVGIYERRMIYIISLYLCQKNVEEAIQFLHGINKEKISVGALTAVVDTLKKEGRVEDAHSLLMESEQNGMPVDVVVYSVIVDGLCKDGHLEKALDICATMSKKGIDLNIVIYNSVIYGLCQQGCLVEAFRLFDSLEQKCLLPTVVTYAILIGALSREGFLQDAKTLFEKMTLNGITPNTRIYNLLINGYCSFGLIEDARKLLSDLEGSCLQPDAFTISAVIGGYCRKGDIESAQVFYGEYVSRDFSPDFLGFMNLIKGLVAKGRMEEARTTLRQMLQCAGVMNLINKAGDELQIESLVSLLAVACDQGRIQEIIDVLSEVGFISYSSWRSNCDYRLRRLTELHNTGALDTDTRRTNSGKVGTYPGMVEVPRNKYESLNGKSMTDDIVDVNHRMCIPGKEESDMYLMGKSLHYDFDTYYSAIASLCSKGELQKANDIVKKMISNPGDSS